MHPGDALKIKNNIHNRNNVALTLVFYKIMRGIVKPLGNENSRADGLVKIPNFKMPNLIYD